MRLTVAASILLAISAAPAFADRIDGEWCGPGSRSLFIDGPAIRTPTGAETIGDYGRHDFRYTGPDGDPEQGVEVLMQQHSEEEMTLVRRTNGADSPPERWTRCKPVS